MKGHDAEKRSQGDAEKQSMGHGEMRRQGKMPETSGATVARTGDFAQRTGAVRSGGYAALQCGKVVPYRPGCFDVYAEATLRHTAPKPERRSAVRQSLTALECGIAARTFPHWGAAQPLLLAVALLCLSFIPAVAQQIGNPTTQQGVTPPRGTYVIRNAHIVTLSGPDIENGTIVIRDGKIDAVGASVSVPSGAQTIDARGLSVYPGMMDAGTAMGLVEVGQGATGTVDTTEVGDLNPNAKAIMAINPHSAHIAVTRVDGVTSAVSLPAGGLISGQAAIINLVGTTPLEMAVVPQAALVINFPRTGRRGGEFGAEQQPDLNFSETLSANERQLDVIRKMIREAESYGRAQDAYAKDKSLPRPDQNIVFEALVPYVRGERPVILRADREAEIRGAIKFAEELKLKPIILGGDDAWKILGLLKEKDVPVILTGIQNLPVREDDAYDTLYENAAKLKSAGVRFCISTGNGGSDVRTLPFHAGLAAAFGLPKEDALKAVTLYPAQIMGVADRLGTIEKGKLANLVVTDGDLLEVRTHVRYLFIDGRQVPLTSRHTQLNDAFKDRR